MTERRLIEVDVTGRSDNKVVAWDAGDGIHKYVAPSVGVSGVRQVVHAVSTSSNATTTASAQNSSLVCSITPTEADSVLVIEVSGSCQAYRVAGSPTRRDLEVWIRNETDAVDVAYGLRGIRLVAASSVEAATSLDIGLRGIYTVDSVDERTFRLRFATTEATNLEAAIRGDQGTGAIMTITEYAP